MSLTKTSIAVLTAVTFAAAAASASACEWHNKQTLAKASPPQTEEQADVNATPLDPVVLARNEASEESGQIEQK